MALKSAQDFLKKRGGSADAGPSSSGLLSASDFLNKRKKLWDTANAQQLSDEAQMDQAQHIMDDQLQNQQQRDEQGEMEQQQQNLQSQLDQPSSLWDKTKHVAGQAWHLLGVPSAMIQEAIAPSSYIGNQTDAQGFTSPRQRITSYFQQNGDDTTGNATADSILRGATGFIAPFVPVAGPGTGLSDVAGNAGVQSLLGRVGAKLGNSALGRIGTAAVEGGLLGAEQNAQYGVTANNQTSLPDLATNAAIGGLSGAALGGGFGAAGEGIRAGMNWADGIAQKYAGSKIGAAIDTYMNSPLERNLSETGASTPLLPPASDESMAAFNRRNTALDKQNGTVLPSSDSPILGQGKTIYDDPNKLADTLGLPAGNYVPPTRMRVLNPEEAFQSVYEKVYPVAQERMTPPLESPKELAKWVQGNLNAAGHDVSLNEVRQLSYEDMRQIATEIKNRMNPYDVVRKTAYDMGYGKQFDKVAPTLQDQLQNFKGAAELGYAPKDLPNVKPSQPFNSQVLGEAAAPIQKVGRVLRDESPVIRNAKAEKGEPILNSDAKNPQPIKLTPKEIARNERIDRFTQTTDDLGVLPDTASQIGSKTDAERVPLSQQANEAYIKGVDNLYRVKQFDSAVDKATGGIKPSESSYKLGLNSRGADMIARQMLENRLVDAQGNDIGDSLKTVMSGIKPKDWDKFGDYLIAKHAPARMGRGETVYRNDLNMTVQKAEAKAAKLEAENPHFADVAKELYDFQNKVGQAWLVDTKLITQDEWDAWRKANPYYVPNQRIFSELEKRSQNTGKSGFANQSKPVKKAVGSQREIVHPIESIIENVAKYVKVAKENEVMQAFYKNVKKDPEAFKDWAEIIQTPKGEVDSIRQNLKDAKSDSIDELISQLQEEFNTVRKKEDYTKGNVISFINDGERLHIRMKDPQLLEALANISPSEMPKWVEVIGKLTKTMKVLTTGLNPVFSLTRNIFRDIPHAYASSKTAANPLTFAADLAKAFADVIGNRQAYQDFKNIGGGHSSSVAADRKLLAQTKENILPSSGVLPTAKRLVTKPFHALENLNNAIESMPRLAEYKRIAKDGTYDSRVEGLYQANDLTTNFNKYGVYTKQLDSIIPYLNASIQGLDQLGRMVKDRPSSLAKAAAAISVPAMLLYAVNRNDPNYWQVSSFTRDNYFLIPKGDGTFVKIAKPRELGMVFGSFLERGMHMLESQDPKSFHNFMDDLLQNFLPPGASGAYQGLQNQGFTGIPGGVLQDTIAGPMISLNTNKDFANRPIVPQDLQKLSPSLQYDAKTSELAKKVGAITGTSPKQLDYIMKSYGGVLGQLGIPATTKGNSVLDALKQQVTVDPAFSNDIGSDFYNAKNKADVAKADAKFTGQPLTRDMSGYYDKISSQITTIRKQMKFVQGDRTLSDDQKKAKLRDLQNMMNTLQSQAMVTK